LDVNFTLIKRYKGKPKKKELLNSNIEKETRELLEQINKILESRAKSIEEYLRNLKAEYTLKAQSKDYTKDKITD